MNRTLQNALRDARDRGIKMGELAYCAAALVAAHNVYDGFMTDEEFCGFFKAWEEEVNRLYREEGADGDFAVRMMGHTDAIRREMGMEEL